MSTARNYLEWQLIICTQTCGTTKSPYRTAFVRQLCLSHPSSVCRCSCSISASVIHTERAALPRRRTVTECRTIISVPMHPGMARWWQIPGKVTELQNVMRFYTTAVQDWTGEKIADTAVDSARSRLPWRRRNWTLAYTTPLQCTCTVSVHYYFSYSHRPLLFF